MMWRKMFLFLWTVYGIWMAIIRRLLNVPLMMLGRVQIYLFIQLTWSVSVTSHEKVSWPLTLRQEIPNIHINVNKGVFYLIISYLRIKSYNVLNYNNCSTDWSFPLSSCMTLTNHGFYIKRITYWLIFVSCSTHPI